VINSILSKFSLNLNNSNVIGFFFILVSFDIKFNKFRFY
jgi:hypothetical protein